MIAKKKAAKKKATLKLFKSILDINNALIEQVDDLTGDMRRMQKALKDGYLKPKLPTKTLSDMSKVLHAALTKGTKQVLVELNDARDGLRMIHAANQISRELSASGINHLKSRAKNTHYQAREAIDNAVSLMGAFVKYCRGIASLISKSQKKASK